MRRGEMHWTCRFDLVGFAGVLLIGSVMTCWAVVVMSS